MGRSLRIDGRKVNGRGLRRRCAAVSEALEGRVMLTVWYVDDTAPVGGDGTSWALAYQDLQSALTVAVANDSIRVGQGTYKPSLPTGRGATFQLKTGVSLIGGYAGYGAGSPDARDVSQFTTTLSGDIGTTGNATDNCYHVVTGSGTTVTAVLDGFIITGGNAGGDYPNDRGGGMYNNRGSPTIRNCVFRSNSAFEGAGMANAATSSPAITNCVFVGNVATARGGGIANYSSPPVLVNCTFSGNTAISAGGGVYNESSSPIVTNCILWGNLSRGGVMPGAPGAPVVTYSIVQDGFDGTTISNADPRFIRNPSPGFDTQWGTADDDYGDLRLRLVSPAIDAGKNAAVPVGIIMDLAGNPRFQEIAAVVNRGTGTAPIADIGAYEAIAGPQAAPGGPYYIAEGMSASLQGVGYSDQGLTLTYAWDLDDDGEYDDAFVPNPTFSAAETDGPLVRRVALKVTDSLGASAVDTTTVFIVPPLYVDDSATGANDGTSWRNAYTSLQSALSAAVPGQTIRVGQGSYRPTTTTDRAISFQLKNTVAIYGGYAGFGASNPDARNVALYPTVLSGDIGIPGDNADNSYHVVTASNADGTAILDGLVITDGNANAGSPNDTGGGGFIAGGAPTLIDCIFRGNSASSGGGLSCVNGTFNNPASPMLVNCTFGGNSASTAGGGIYCFWGVPVLSNCTFSGNSASQGAGLYNSSGSPLVTNCTFTCNFASSIAGGIYSTSSSPTFNNCIVWGNTPASSQLYGGLVISYSDVEGGYTGTGNISSDPQFLRMPVPGPDGRWGTPDDDYGDLRLRLTSPAIDAGKNAALPVSITTDRAGNPRFVDVPSKPDTGPGTVPIVDIGAYEAVPALQVAASKQDYYVIEGGTVALEGFGYSDEDPALSYAWDLDSDGEYDDAFVPNPTFSAASLRGPLTCTVALRITDSSGASAMDTAVIVVVRPLYVDDSATGAGDGASWTDAFTNLQSALASAGAGQIICVAQGTYTPTATNDRAISFQLTTGVAIYGGYAGVGTDDPYARETALYASVLSGDIGAFGDKTDNSYHVVTGSGTNSTAVLDGFIIKEGNANGSYPTDRGGGLHSSGGSPTIQNCAFSGNSAGAGGGIYSGSASPTLANCTFSNNSAANGGGMCSDAFWPVLKACTFLGNSASSSGGGFYSTSDAAVLTNCSFIRNSANSGGAVYGNPVLNNCLFSGNTASYGGGLYRAGSGSPVLTNCTFASNLAINTGGAIHNASAATKLNNCIIWGNSPAASQLYGSFVITYSDVQGGYAGTGNINIDPQFVRSPAPGPDGKWGTADDDPGDLRLRLISPAIDAANNSALPAEITTDLAGNPRFHDIAVVANTGSGAAPIVDLGAYEAVPGLQAAPGGRYYILEGVATALQGAGYSDQGLALTYAWDFDADGQYDDAFGPNPTFSAAGMQGPMTLTVSLKVIDALGATATETATVTIVHPLFVDDSATGAGNGTAWTDAYTTLQAALSAAVAGQTICVAQGIYKPVSTGFNLKNGVTICGGWAGIGAANPYARDIRQCATILSGDTGIVGDPSDNSALVNSDSNNATGVLDGFTITGGVGWEGAGLRILGGSPTIRNCTFVGNRCNISSRGGGAVYNFGSSTSVTCTPTFINCVFVGNTGDYGGAIYNRYAYPTFINCVIAGNSATYSGGGIWNASSNPVLTNCIVWGNTASQASQMYNASTSIISYCDIQGGFTGTGNINADPQFVRNPSRGADGKWGTADDDYGDLRLLPTSPCIDAGNNAPLISGGVTTDRAGYTRFFDVPAVADTGAGTAPIVDMGAYETRILSLSATPGEPSFGIGLTADRSALQVLSAQGMQSYGAGYFTAMSLAGGTGASTVTIDLANGNPIPGAGMSVDGFAVVVQHPAATDALVLGSGVGRINGNPILTSNVPSVRLDSSAKLIQLSSLSLTDTGRLDLAAGKLLRVSGLAVADTARLDLGGGSLVVQAGSSEAGVVLARVTELLRLARSGGAWVGAGIGSSSVAAGYTLAGIRNRGEDGTKLMESFGGQPVDADSIIVTLARAGDVDLSGRIDSGDYFRLDRGLLLGGANYRDGDLDYSGGVDADDYTLMDWAFLNQVPAGKAAMAQTAGAVFSDVKIEEKGGMGGSPMSFAGQGLEARGTGEGGRERHGRAARATVSVGVPVAAAVAKNGAVVLGRSVREMLRADRGVLE